jgi:penicillin amidase
MTIQNLRIGLVLALTVAFSQGLILQVAKAASEKVVIPNLDNRVALLRDEEGIPHIFAQNPQDLFLAQGWVHARDRLFQMDVLRRQASGTLAELVGPEALESDIQLRTIGLRRAAERSWEILTPQTQDALTAYAAGVNAYIASAVSLPIEYGALELSEVEPWTPVDSLTVAKLLSFSLSFDLDIAPTLALQAYQAALPGLQGLALYFEDTHRSAPFDTPATVPDALGGPITAAESAVLAASETVGPGRGVAWGLDDESLALARGYLKRVEKLPLLQYAIDPNKYDRGSNAWIVAGTLTDSGRPFLASDQHLSLSTPATFYPIHLVSKASGYDVIGDSLPGAPFVLVGHNRDLAWGTTNNRLDVTDTFAEQLVPDPASPSGLSSLYLSTPEPVIPLPQVFRYNQPTSGEPDDLTTAPSGGDVNGVTIPPVVLIVPRRNNGPILDMDPVTGMALSVQYTGFSGTREADAFRLLNVAESLDDVTHALQFFDVGAQHFMIADRSGNIAYFTNAELPLREDLQSETVSGLPPYFIRNGQGGNEWLPDGDPQPGQSLPHEILPFEEMPQAVNPPSNMVSNANNDPLGITFDNDPLNQLRPGGGILYLAPRFSFGTRAERIRQELAERAAAGLMTPQDMIDIQADVVLRDAQVFTPYILQAFTRASNAGAHPDLAAIAEDPGIAEAVGRLAAWDHTAPTGIYEGFDASDADGVPSDPSDEEIANSIAATIYSVWRGRMVIHTIDATLGGLGLPSPDDEQSMTALRHLLDTFDSSNGFGISGINFFDVPGITDPANRRDYVILMSLADTLSLLASEDFADAFAGLSDQEEYRWGLLHRLVLAHPLGRAFSIPPQPGLGFAVDGGFGTVDAGTHILRVTTSEDFGFPEGPTRRYVGEVGAGKGSIVAESSLPGGTSGVPGDPFQANLLFHWLTNDTYLLRQARNEIAADTAGFMYLSP